MTDRQDAAGKGAALAEAFEEPADFGEAFRAKDPFLGRPIDKRCGPAASRDQNGEGQTGAEPFP